ncbi:DEAD-box ATP-dependent RNA helicase chloroplastic-like, partial [Trifolium pratense]
MDTHNNTLSVSSHLLLLHPLRLLSSSSSSCYIPRSHNNNHFLKLFSPNHINRFSNFTTTPLPAIANPSPTTPTLRDICQPHVPDQFLQRMEEVGYVMPTEVQKQALPHLFSGRDCILHAQ